MNDFKIGDKVRFVSPLKPDVQLYQGVIVGSTNSGSICLVEIAEGSGIWSNAKFDTIPSHALEKLDKKQ